MCMCVVLLELTNQLNQIILINYPQFNTCIHLIRPSSIASNWQTLVHIIEPLIANFIGSLDIYNL